MATFSMRIVGGFLALELRSGMASERSVVAGGGTRLVRLREGRAGARRGGAGSII
jgi:hypothetical protein